MPFLLIFAIVLLPLWFGLFFLVRGLRGRVIDDHPVCRKCGFDLFGLPEGVQKCSECGADLTRPKAIRAGNRRRRPGMVWLGALLLAPGVCGVGLILLSVVSNVKWIEYEPTWYVIRQSQSSIPADRTPALQELLRRLNAGELSDERIAQITDAQLAWQADMNTPWAPERGDLIDAAQVAGKLSKEKWSQYFQNGVSFKLVTRPEVRRGDAVPMRVQHSADRVGSRTQIGLSTEMKLLPSDLVDMKKNRWGGGSGSSSIGRGGMGSSGYDVVLDPKLVAAVKDGTQTLHVQLEADLYDRPNSSGPATASKTFDLQTTWDLVPADAPTVKPIPDNGEAPAVEKCIKINQLQLNPQNPDYENLSIQFTNVPVPLACKIILRSGDREWEAGHIYVGKNGTSGWGTGAQVKNFDANTVDVIFRADERTALDTIDMHEYWTGEAIIKNVPVTRSKK